jgi:hypothetical protein
MEIFLIIWAAWTAVVADPPRLAATEHIDLVEVNHYFDDCGKPVFDQLIFYNRDESARRYNVVAWRLLKNPNQLPVRHPLSGKYYASWHDGKILRIIHADQKMETWTQYDPETHERKFLPKSSRSDLLRIDAED